MKFSTLPLFFATTLAVPTSLDIKRDTASDAKGQCKNHEFRNGDEHALVIHFRMGATIGGDGNPNIEDDGGIYTFSKDCEELDSKEWNGGRGTLGPLYYMDSAFGDLNLKFYHPAALASSFANTTVTPFSKCYPVSAMLTRL